MSQIRTRVITSHTERRDVHPHNRNQNIPSSPSMNPDPVPPVRRLLTHVIADEPLRREAGISACPYGTLNQWFRTFRDCTDQLSWRRLLGRVGGCSDSLHQTKREDTITCVGWDDGPYFVIRSGTRGSETAPDHDLH